MHVVYRVRFTQWPLRPEITLKIKRRRSNTDADAKATDDRAADGRLGSEYCARFSRLTPPAQFEPAAMARLHFRNKRTVSRPGKGAPSPCHNLSWNEIGFWPAVPMLPHTGEGFAAVFSWSSWNTASGADGERRAFLKSSRVGSKLADGGDLLSVPFVSSRMATPTQQDTRLQLPFVAHTHQSIHAGLAAALGAHRQPGLLSQRRAGR